MDPAYRRLRQLALYTCEQAKIELSQTDSTYIRMYEDSILQKDLDGKDIYLDIPYSQEQLNQKIRAMVDLTIQVSREVISKAGVTADQIQRIVFIGGPTMYPPLQERVMRELKVRQSGSSNPMTAVAEGASIYAESVDWSSGLHKRLDPIARMTEKDLDIRYEKRVSAQQARIALISHREETFNAEVVSVDTGWSSGKVIIEGKGIVEVPLYEMGKHTFVLTVRDENDREVFRDPQLSITRIMATVEAIPSSHSIALKVLDKVGGKAVPLYLVRENEQLPKRGTVSLRAGKRLIAGSGDALVFTLWEGEIEDPIEDNRYIGTYRIPGTSFFSGVVPVGAEILCEYEISDSGNLLLGVSIPSVGAALAQQNYYSSQDGQLDLEDPSQLLEAAHRLKNRLLLFTTGRLRYTNMIFLRNRLEEIIDDLQKDDPEIVQGAANDLLDCQREAARFRQEHLDEVRVADLNGYRSVVDEYRTEADVALMEPLDELYESARRAIDRGSAEYESILNEYRVRSWAVLQKLPGFLESQFRIRIQKPQDYSDPQKFNEMRAKGLTCIENKDYEGLKAAIHGLNKIEKPALKVNPENMYDPVNVVKG